MKISSVRVTPITIKDPALLNAAGVHEPFDLQAEFHQAFLNCRIRTRNDVTQMQKFRPDWSTVKPRF